jgi:uncharacterized phiE125 gp8 family phage protein
MMTDLQRLELVTAPAALPVSLSEVKAQLRIEHDDENNYLDRLINAAIAMVDAKGILGQAIITQTWAQWLPQTPDREILLAIGPVQSVDAVKYYDDDGILQTDTLANFDVFGLPFSKIVKPKTGFNWPIPQVRPDAIKIEYTVGYGDTSASVPDTIRHAMLMLIAYWYENRENELIGVNSKTLPFGFDDLLNLHRERWYG